MGKVGNVFILPNVTDYSELRSDKEARSRKDAFNKLAGYISDELDFKSDIGCYCLFAMYRQALKPIPERLSPLNAKYGEIIDFLSTEDVFGCIDDSEKIIGNAVAAINKVIDKINAMSNDVNGWCSDIKNLLVPNIVENISEYRVNADLYEKLCEQLKLTSQDAKTLLCAVISAQNIQSDLYVDVEQGEDIANNIKNALDAVNVFFGLINDACGPDKNEEKAKPKTKKETSLVDKFKELSVKFGQLKKCLEDCTGKYQNVCRECRQRDIENLKALHARVQPKVPTAEDCLFLLKLDGIYKIEKDKIDFDKVATLALADIVKVYGDCEDEASEASLKEKPALLSPAALAQLNLISEDAESILIVDSGYPIDKNSPVGQKLIKAYRKGYLLAANQILYISKSAYIKLFT